MRKLNTSERVSLFRTAEDVLLAFPSLLLIISIMLYVFKSGHSSINHSNILIVLFSMIIWGLLIGYVFYYIRSEKHEVVSKNMPSSLFRQPINNANNIISSDDNFTTLPFPGCFSLRFNSGTFFSCFLFMILFGSDAVYNYFLQEATCSLNYVSKLCPTASSFETCFSLSVLVGLCSIMAMCHRQIVLLRNEATIKKPFILESTHLGASWRQTIKMAFLISLFTTFIYFIIASSLASGFSYFYCIKLVIFFCFSVFFCIIFASSVYYITLLSTGQFSFCEVVCLSNIFALIFSPCCMIGLLEVVTFITTDVVSLQHYFSPNTFFSGDFQNNELIAAFEILCQLGCFLFLFLILSLWTLKRQQSSKMNRVQSVSVLDTTENEFNTYTQNIDSPNVLNQQHMKKAGITQTYMKQDNSTHFENICGVFLLSCLFGWFFKRRLLFLNISPFQWLCHFLMKHTPVMFVFSQRLVILVLWGLIAPIFIFFTQTVASSSYYSNSIINILIRKSYHLACLFSFLPLIIVGDVLFLSCVLLSAFGCLLAAEAIRITAFPHLKLQIAIQTFLDRFIDLRDRRGIIITHLYLLLGIMFPIIYEFLSSSYHTRLFDPFAASVGFFSTGVADAAAAICGTLGHCQLPGLFHRKTWEGLCGFFLTFLCSNILFLYIMNIPMTYINTTILFLITMEASLFEAFTLEIDNFILPLITLSTYYCSQCIMLQVG